MRILCYLTQVEHVAYGNYVILISSYMYIQVFHSGLFHESVELGSVSFLRTEKVG